MNSDNETDLERHVNATGRDELVKQVRTKIDALGISYIYYQFIHNYFILKYQF